MADKSVMFPVAGKESCERVRTRHVSACYIVDGLAFDQSIAIARSAGVRQSAIVGGCGEF